MVIHNKYTDSLHMKVLINANVKIVTAWVRLFQYQGQNFNKLGRGLLTDAIYQIKTLYILRFQKVNDLFMLSLYKISFS